MSFNVQTVRSPPYTRDLWSVNVRIATALSLALSLKAGIRLVPMAARAADGRPDLPEDGPGRAETPGQAINPLQRLIQERLRDRRWSYGAVARRGGLPRSTVYTLATTRNLVRPPRPATIDALAIGLDVPVSVVRAAAGESTGLHYYDEAPNGQHDPDDRERELLIASIDELSPDDRRHVAALVESLRNRASPDQQQTG
jgi:transcriptional regulator with XRE-family HTH domain